MSDPVLCYVEGSFAYFTSIPLGDQWGDDWDDASYEHNAGEPYESNQQGSCGIVKVAFDGDFAHARELGRYSVERINAGESPWLLMPAWYCRGKIEIPAGTTLSRFRELIALGGGRVYEEARGGERGGSRNPRPDRQEEPR